MAKEAWISCRHEKFIIFWGSPFWYGWKGGFESKGVPDHPTPSVIHHWIQFIELNILISYLTTSDQNRVREYYRNIYKVLEYNIGSFNAISFKLTGDALLNFDDTSLNKSWITFNWFILIIFLKLKLISTIISDSPSVKDSKASKRLRFGRKFHINFQLLLL